MNFAMGGSVRGARFPCIRLRLVAQAWRAVGRCRQETVLSAAWGASDDHRQSTAQTAFRRYCEGFHDVYQDDALRIIELQAAPLPNGVYRWERRQFGVGLQNGMGRTMAA